VYCRRGLYLYKCIYLTIFNFFNNFQFIQLFKLFFFTKFKAVFASGSPFEKVVHEDKTFFPGQANNCYIFPAIGLAVSSCCLSHITEELLLAAAKVNVIVGLIFC
jgi:hypothetical protein